MRSGPNKTRAWRKTKRQLNPETNKVERYGRRFRNVMMQIGMQKQSILPIHSVLFGNAGIPTPIFDEQLKSRYHRLPEQVITHEATYDAT